MPNHKFNLKIMKQNPIHLLIILVAMLTGCVGNNVLKLHKMPNYRANSPLIMFMDFKVVKSGENSEKVTLNNAILGVGEMRPQDMHPETSIQLKAVLKGTNDEVLGEWYLDHPLYKIVEVMNETGKPERVKLDLPEGIVSLRFQQNPQQKNLELYRVEADKTSHKIFNVDLKP